MGELPKKAMVLAAGLGLRLRPLTNDLPKPLLQVNGSTMLDQVLKQLEQVGVEEAVVNTHYKAEQIEQHVRQCRRPKIILSKEPELLDTGGGVKNALPKLGPAPFFVINADLPWQDGAEPMLKRLADHFDESKMDAMLLLAPLAKANGFDKKKGDFFLDDNGKGFGRIRRAGMPPPRPYVFISAQLVHPRIYASIPDKIFSNNLIWDKAERAGRLYGLIHDGSCYHVGTPEDYQEANRLLASGQGW
jgi:MurNAc alpha-1-phosphate uridylyltransferase